MTKDQIDLLRTTVCKGATEDELRLFLQFCHKTKLDPFAKQIWALKRWDSKEGKEVMSIQVSIDGLRLIAERSKKYRGQVGPFFCGNDGVWKDVWIDQDPPVACKVGVLHKDFQEPLFAVCKFSSYASLKKDGGLTPMWAKMPDVMIAKVAESLALRKAFPQDLSGVYGQEEMEQALPPPKVVVKEIPASQPHVRIQEPEDLEAKQIEMPLANGKGKMVEAMEKKLAEKKVQNFAPGSGKP